MQKSMDPINDRSFSSKLPHIQPFFTVRSHATIWRTLRSNIARGEGVIVITGAAGIGKTQLLYRLQGLLPENWDIALIEEGGEPQALFTQTLCEAAGAEIAGPQTWAITIGEVLDAVANRVEFGRNFLVVIDQAEQLTQENLNVVNSLLLFAASQGGSVQVVLAGRPELSRSLELPAFQLLRNAVIVTIEISPLTRVEVWEYIRFQAQRMLGRIPRMTWPAWLETYAASQGNPEQINLLLHEIIFSNKNNMLRYLTGPLVRRGRMALDANYHPPPGQRLTPWVPVLLLLPVLVYLFGVPFDALTASVRQLLRFDQALSPVPSQHQPSPPQSEAAVQPEKRSEQSLSRDGKQGVEPGKGETQAIENGSKPGGEPPKVSEKAEDLPTSPTPLSVREAPSGPKGATPRPMPEAKPLKRSTYTPQQVAP
ncbi:MAG: AAA family ATPase [Magnetococcales bacterium]|nr:AAA family ATPase [Magnetococcales bacterium]